jgi:hypothetical protein
MSDETLRGDSQAGSEPATSTEPTPSEAPTPAEQPVAAEEPAPSSEPVTEGPVVGDVVSKEVTPSTEAQPAEGQAAPPPAPPSKGKGPRWRRTLAWVFLILGLILLPMAVTGGWVRGNIFSTDGFVNMVGPLGSNPAVQDQIAVSATNQIFNALDLETRLQGVLPNRLGFLAGPVTDRVKAWTLEGAQALVHSDQFAAIWTKAMQGVHTQLVAFFNGSGKVYLDQNGMITLDLSGLTTRIVDRLSQVGVEIPADKYPVLTSGQVPIAEAARLDKVRGLLNFLNKLFIVLPILTVLFLAGSVAIAVRRQRAAVRAGIGMMISMAIFVLILAIGRHVFLNATTGAGISSDAAGAMWGQLTIAMRATAWALFIVGLLLFVHPYVVRAFRGTTIERAAGGAAGRGWDTGPVGRFFARHRVPLALAVLVIGFLALVLSGGPPVWAIVLVAVIVVIVDAVIFFIARLSELAAKARAEVIDESA